MNSKNSRGKKTQNTKSEEQEAQWTDAANNKAAIDEEDKEESEEEYEVEIVVDKMIKKGTVFYKVKWKNYSLEDATWEPEANLGNAPLKIREYENQLLAKKAAETPKEIPKETPKEVPKEILSKPEAKKEDVKAEEPSSQDKKAIKKGASNKPASVEPESITGKRDRQTFEDEKMRQEEKASKSKKEKPGKKKSEENTEQKATQEKAPSDTEEERISKMKKLSPNNSGQPESQVTQTKDSSGNIKGINTQADKGTSLVSYPPPVKYAPKDLSHQTSVEKEQIEKIYDQLFANAKQAPTSTGKKTPLAQNPLSETKGPNAMVEEKDPKANSSVKVSQELNKGMSLSKIMQDEKLMEMSETESINRSEAQDNERKNQGSETSPADDSKSGSKSKKKGRSEYGSLEKGDIPLKVVGIRPVKEDKDLEIMISWKTREDGVKPYNSKVMRIDLLRSGFYMPLIEFYESKMKLEGAPAFDPGMLPKV